MSKKKKNPRFNPSKRFHHIGWLLCKINDLEEKGNRLSDSSNLIYCCLELRNVLEIIELELLLASIPQHERQEIKEIAKEYSGIDKANNKLKTLKDSRQKFYEIACANNKIYGKVFNYKQSVNLKTRLSKYIHTYYREESELEFESIFMSECILLISETRDFIISSILNEQGEYEIKSLSLSESSSQINELFEKFKIGNLSEEKLLEEFMNISSIALTQRNL